jgi:hypothetical protein
VKKFVIIVGTLTIIASLLVISTQYVTLTIKQTGSETYSFDVEDAEAVDVLVDVVAANMTLSGNASQLFHGVFDYAHPSSRANVNYATERGTGILSVAQPASTDGPRSAEGNAYDMQLSSAIPITLHVQISLGKTDLELAGLSLNRLDASLGNGDDVVNLPGAYPSLTYLILNSGQGQDSASFDCECDSLTNVVLGLETEDDTVDMNGSYAQLASLNVDSGSGDDSITLDGEYPLMNSMTVNLGAGDDHLTVHGNYPSLSVFVVNVGIGDDVVDLNQAWQHSLDVIIISESNSTSLQLPGDIGVSVQVIGRAPVVNVEGLTQQGDAYVNDLFGETDTELRISLNTSSIETVNITVNEAP